MPIDTVHDEYADNQHKWMRMRDVLAGADAVKGRAEAYLPRLEAQGESEYLAYRDRTPFWNATARTHEGLVGMLFRKDPTVKMAKGEGGASKSMNNFWLDADLKGNSLEAYSRNITEEVLAVGRGGTLVDWDAGLEQPFFIQYKAEDVLSWRTERVENGIKLTLVVLNESTTNPDHSRLTIGTTSDNIAKGGDPYTDKVTDRIRVLRLVPQMDIPPEEGAPTVPMQYIAEIWEKATKEDAAGKTSTHWVLTDIEQPDRKGKFLEDIPFVFHGSDDGDASVDRPPLEDLAELNIDHYKTTADYKHGMHYTALPTAWVAGFPEKTILKIGSSTAWISPEPTAHAGFLEFTGKGLSEFSTYLEKSEIRMAVLGARLLEQQKKSAEAAETLQIRQGGEASVLQHVAGVISTTLTRAVKIAAWWSGTADSPEEIEDDAVSIAINTDFVAVKLSSTDVVALTSAWIQRGISRNTLHWNLQQGEILPPGRTPEQEEELLGIEGALGRPGEDDSGPPVNPEDED